MSLDQAKLPSLKDKLRDQIPVVSVITENEEVGTDSESIVVKKGRRLNK